ncbi:MAG: hypothetical protein ACO2PO_16175 [Candidatus Calescibacterium sp.]
MRNSNGRIALIKSKLYTLFYSYLILLFIFLGEGKSQTFNVPTGSWATGILLTGISVALPGTVVDPGPVVFRIEDGFYTPADGYVDMTGCYAHGTAYWADHISRVVIEIKHITCPQGNKIYEIETLGYIYDQFGNFGYGANINEFEKEIWGLKIRTGIAQVPAFSPGVLFIRQGFTIMRKEKKGPGWRRPLTFPENIKNFPP